MRGDERLGPGRSWTARLTAVLNVLMAAYVVGYVVFRQLNTEVSPEGGGRHVVFPQEGGLVLSYLWRPLSYLDLRITGTGTRIGPRRG